MNCNGVNGTGYVATPGCENTSSTSSASEVEIGGALLQEATLLMNSGDIGAEIAALSILSSHSQRTIAKQIRQVEEKTLAAAEAAELSAMREKAEHARNASFIGGFTTCAGGLITIGSATPAVAGKKPATDVNAATAQTKPTADLKTMMEGSAAVVQGGGKAWSAHAQYAADRAGEESTKQEQIASRQKRALEDTRDMDANAKKHMDKILDLFKEYSSAKQDATRAALYRA